MVSLAFTGGLWDISKGGLLKTQLQLLQFQTDVSSAQMALIQALANLRQLLGYDAVPENYDVIGELTYAVHITEDLEVMALKARPDLMVAERGVTATQSQNTLAKTNGKRNLTVSLSVQSCGRSKCGGLRG
jgi:cobalt-zinc-cadmium efflux system outer membrane protein